MMDLPSTCTITSEAAPTMANSGSNESDIREVL